MVEKEKYLNSLRNVDLISDEGASLLYDSVKMENYDMVFMLIDRLFHRLGRANVNKLVFPEFDKYMSGYQDECHPDFINGLYNSHIDNLIFQIDYFNNEYNGNYILLDVLHLNDKDELVVNCLDLLGTYFIQRFIGKPNSEIRKYFKDVYDKVVKFKQNGFDQNTCKVLYELVYTYHVMQLVKKDARYNGIDFLYHKYLPYIKCILHYINAIYNNSNILELLNASRISVKYTASFGSVGLEEYLRRLTTNLARTSLLRVVIENLFEIGYIKPDPIKPVESFISAIEEPMVGPGPIDISDLIENTNDSRNIVDNTIVDENTTPKDNANYLESYLENRNAR